MTNTISPSLRIFLTADGEAAGLREKVALTPRPSRHQGGQMKRKIYSL